MSQYADHTALGRTFHAALVAGDWRAVRGIIYRVRDGKISFAEIFLSDVERMDAFFT